MGRKGLDTLSWGQSYSPPCASKCKRHLVFTLTFKQDVVGNIHVGRSGAQASLSCRICFVWSQQLYLFLMCSTAQSCLVLFVVVKSQQTVRMHLPPCTFFTARRTLWVECCIIADISQQWKAVCTGACFPRVCRLSCCLCVVEWGPQQSLWQMQVQGWCSAPCYPAPYNLNGFLMKRSAFTV